MRRINPRIIFGLETYRVRDKVGIENIKGYKLGYYNPPELFEYNGKYAVLGSGSQDDLTFYIEGNNIYFLCENHNLKYIGLSVYDRKTLEKTNEVFFQNNYEIEELSNNKRDIFDYSQSYKVRKLLQYFY